MGSWSDSRSLGLLGSAVLEARSSWSSRAHPLASCFVSLALLVSLNSFVYLRERHISWGFSALEAFEGSCSESWSLGLAVLEPHAHAFVWYFFSLVWLVSLVVISLVVISLVVLCLQQATSTCNTSREASPKQRACTPARRARRERSGKQAARVHATVSRATSVQAANRPISKQRCTCACEYHERGSQASAGTQRAYRVCCTRARTSVCVREAQCSERDEACEGAAKPSALSHSLIRVANSVATELQL